MEAKSTYSKKAAFLFLLLLVPIAVLYFVCYIIINSNKEELLRYELLVFLLLFLWFPTLFLFMIMQQYKSICVTSDKVIIERIFGLSKKAYNLEELKRADYAFGYSHGIVLQQINGEQITIGAKEYENYYKLTRAIVSVVQADQSIKVKYFTKGLKVLTGIGGLLLLLFVINQAF